MLQKTLLKLFPDVGVVLISRNGNEENGHGPDGVDDGVEGVITSWFPSSGLVGRFLVGASADKSLEFYKIGHRTVMWFLSLHSYKHL